MNSHEQGDKLFSNAWFFKNLDCKLCKVHFGCQNKEHLVLGRLLAYHKTCILGGLLANYETCIRAIKVHMFAEENAL